MFQMKIKYCGYGLILLAVFFAGYTIGHLHGNKHGYDTGNEEGKSSGFSEGYIAGEQGKVNINNEISSSYKKSVPVLIVHDVSPSSELSLPQVILHNDTDMDLNNVNIILNDRYILNLNRYYAGQSMKYGGGLFYDKQGYSCGMEAVYNAKLIANSDNGTINATGIIFRNTTVSGLTK